MAKNIKAGDTVRVTKPEAGWGHRVGEQFVVTSVHTEGWSTHEGVALGEGISDESGFWFEELKIVEPEPEFQKGDKVRVTPKAGGETVIVGEIHDNRSHGLNIKIENLTGYYFDHDQWNIEKIRPSTVDILNGLGENAFVAHRTSLGVHGYIKRGGEWFAAIGITGSNDRSPERVASYIDHGGFEIIFEGVKW